MISTTFYKFLGVAVEQPVFGKHFISESLWQRYKAFRASLGEHGALSSGRPLPRWKDISAKVEAVHREVSGRFIYTPDGNIDHWDVPKPDAEGRIRDDCDGYAGYCKLRLLQEGLDESWLRMTLCWTETGGYHMVLTVRSRDGDFIIDNRNLYLVWRWFSLDYHWHFREDGKGSFEALGGEA